MGLSFSKHLQPEELAILTNSYQAEREIPEPADNRQPTDKKFLNALGVMLIVLLPFLIYTLCYSDIDRHYGYDQCGNICGKKNAKYDQWDCTGKDYTNNKFLQFKGNPGSDITLVPRDCVAECSEGLKVVLGRLCMDGYYSASELILQQLGDELEEFLQSMAWRLILACLMSLGIALSILYLFRVAAVAMVWSILVGVVTFLTFLVGALWNRYFQKDRSIEIPIIFTIVLVILVTVIVFFYKKIALVTAIFKEAMKATFAMPRLLLIPIVTFLVNLLIAAIFFIILSYMLSAGVLTPLTSQYFKYQANIVMSFSTAFFILMTFWVSQFFIGIQYMVIAGAVSKWYFAKNKEYLGSPILTSASIAFNFHLGSVAFGSLIVTIIAVVRSLLSSLLKNRIARACFDCWTRPIEDFLKYLTKSSYILTAMHGKPFFKSGKRAAQLLLLNITNIAVLKFIGDFVIFMAHVLAVLLSLLFTYLIMQDVDSPYNQSVYWIVGIVSLIVAAICFSIFETVIDTIYLCFCEDKLLNDGMVRPYAMSRDLMEFMEESKKVCEGKREGFVEL